MVSEEFSFPTISTNVPQLSETTTLWRITSENLDEFVGNGSSKISSGSFCDMRDLTEEESMDLLWENFNDQNDYDEEIESKTSLELNCCTDFEYVEENDSEICSSNSSTMKVSRINNSGFLSGKKHRMSLILKVLKKLLLLRNTARLKKKENF